MEVIWFTDCQEVISTLGDLHYKVKTLGFLRDVFMFDLYVAIVNSWKACCPPINKEVSIFQG